MLGCEVGVVWLMDIREHIYFLLFRFCNNNCIIEKVINQKTKYLFNVVVYSVFHIYFIIFSINN